VGTAAGTTTQVIFDLRPRVLHAVRYRSHSVPHAGLHLPKILVFGLGDEVFHKTTKENIQWGYVWWPRRRGNWVSSADPSARHCVIESASSARSNTTIFSSAISHKRRCAYCNPQHASKHMHRGRILSGYSSCHQRFPHLQGRQQTEEWEFSFVIVGMG